MQLRQDVSQAACSSHLRLLQAKGHSPEHTAKALKYVGEQHMLNDRRHAKVFALSMWGQKCWAPCKIRQVRPYVQQITWVQRRGS